jgi:hypothetical protein
MIRSVTTLVAVLQTLFLTQAAELARATRLCQRARKLPGDVLAQTCVFGWLHDPHASLDDLTDLARAAGVTVTPQALHDRLCHDACPAFFESLLCAALEYACAVDVDLPALLAPFTGVYAFDTTHVVLPDTLADVFPSHGGSSPADNRAAVHLQVCLEITAGGLVDVQLAPARTADLRFDLAHTGLPVGSLRLADLGFADLDLLAAYQREEVYWVGRWHAHWTLYDEQGHKHTLDHYLAQQEGWRVDTQIDLGARRLPVRLVAFRLSDEAANRRRQAYLRKTRDKGRPPSRRTLRLCDWDISVGRLPEGIAAAGVQALRRLRWQVELLFKLFKGCGGLDRLRGHKGNRVRAELYAQLLGQVVQSWQLLVSVGGLVGHSWYRCRRALRHWWVRVVELLTDTARLVEAMSKRGPHWQRRARKQKRRKRPSAAQMIEDPQRALDVRQGWIPLT